MLLLTETTSTTMRVSPQHHCPGQNSLTSQNGFVSFPKSSTTSRAVSSDMGNPHTTLPPSGSFKKPINQPITDCNTQIRKFCEVGNLRMAMDLVCNAQKSELELATYCSVLQLCADFKSLDEGRKVHSFIDSCGIEMQNALAPKLAFMYLSCGDLREGRRVFDRMANEKVFLWNMLLSEYAKIGNFEESIMLYERMVEFGVEANSYTFSCILKCLAAKKSVVKGERVHGYLLKLGFGAYNTVVNSLIAFYFKCGRTESARKLFDELCDRDVITWNSMISGYTANGLAEKGVEVFIDMLRTGIRLDLATIVSVLAASANVGVISLGRSLHAYAIKAGFNKEITFNNTLIGMYTNCGDIDGASHIFYNLGERSVVSCTSMIAGYARDGLSDKAIALFHEMKMEGIKPDIFSVTSILHACACSGSLEDGKEVHNYIRENNMDLDVSVSNALMDMYAKCGSMEDALSVFSQMLIKDIVSWNTMIGGYSKNSMPNEALHLFGAMQQELKPDIVTLTCVLPSCASLAALDRGREVHAHSLRNGLAFDNYVVNALIDMYVKCGALVLAQSLFDKTPVKDLVSWVVMVAGYGMHGFGREAIAAFKKMRKAGIVADEVSFISILHACSHSGLLHEGWRFFDIMRNDCNIKPKLEHYACMVDLLARSGKLSKAYRFVETMPIEPDASVWGALLCGCRIHHDVKLAEKVAEHIFKLEPDNMRYYVLIATIYAEAEKWEEVKKLKERIGRRGLRKNPCCSWIEIKGKHHIFVAGDNSYPQAKTIDSLIKEWSTKMKAEGYFPKLRYALTKGEHMQKETPRCGHTERRAMAFGIMSFPPGKIIRITKNLRVCSECHEMAKYVSKKVGSEIVLRDSNRFHHFKNGSCSCRGYW
ncbi:pentatricopeptide repeat-containing protein DOT4, chloroplastic [Rhododendron vialii]|uniref:pentatricopeptide repeat-containing protein DOT4, chloroplastic n=1 Tax=Rhododendron vialii TaxID=182163 RepID=UPI00265FAD42|nr:pentatricopeptide repeat-containing protein DOT4, chloroplastic [Rhododendron vialii]